MNRFDRWQPLLWFNLVFLVDFVTKRLVLANVETLQQKVCILGDLLRFTYVRNPGSAMGLFPLGRVPLIIISLVAIGFLTFLFRHTSAHLKIRRCALAAIMGGALGNLVDRIFYDGLVVDFIDIGLGDHRFYTFNVADMGVTLGGAVLFLSLMRESMQRTAVSGAETSAANEAQGAVEPSVSDHQDTTGSGIRSEHDDVDSRR